MKQNTTRKFISGLFLATIFIINLNAQTISNRNSQLHQIANKIEKYYIFEDIGKELSSKLKHEIKNKTFDKLSNQEFADSLSSYLENNSKDLHFNVLYSPNYKKEPIENEKELLKKYDAINRQWNYGFEKVARLDGNIGYIQYTGFPAANNNAKNVLAATMNFVSNTNALILDLRDNRGGDSVMATLFLSYFFKDKTIISSTYTRFNNTTNTLYTINKVRGEKYLNKPIYVLVGNNTISAAEALAYNLQQNGKAIVIGKKTHGAANPVKAFFIDNLYYLFIPVTEEKNAVSQTNWEHKGVKLDVEIDSNKALIKAHVLGLEKLLNHEIKIDLTVEEATTKISELKDKL